MIWSGTLIYWANDVYRLGWGDKTILKFFPDSFNKALNIPFRLAEGMSDDGNDRPFRRRAFENPKGGG